MERNNLRDYQNNFNAYEKGSDLKSEKESECKAVIPLEKEKESFQATSEATFGSKTEAAYEREDKKIRYRKKAASHILFVKAYLLFFFLGACFCVSGKFGLRDLAENLFQRISVPSDNFPDFCVRFSPLLFGSFFVFASGFTIYAFLLSVIYSVSAFFLCGVVASEVVYRYGFSLEAVAVLILTGFFCAECILFCSVTRGISEIASNGISKLSIQDGILYSFLYIATVFLNYYILMLICFLLKPF